MRPIALVALVAAFSAVPAFADEAHRKANAPRPAAAASSALTEGEVRKVDKDARKITLRHGPLAKLDMPAMTMVFQVKDPAFLDKVKAGDKVRFDAEKVGGAYTVTQIEKAD